MITDSINIIKKELDLIQKETGKGKDIEHHIDMLKKDKEALLIEVDNVRSSINSELVNLAAKKDAFDKQVKETESKLAAAGEEIAKQLNAISIQKDGLNRQQEQLKESIAFYESKKKEAQELSDKFNKKLEGLSVLARS